MKIRNLARKKKKARIEIIPMIDTMFFLLVFFMIATLSMTVMRGMPVNLPKTETGKKMEKENHFLTVSSKGGIYLDKKKTPLDEVYHFLKEEISSNPETLVIINADAEVNHGRIMEVMDTVKLAGVTKLAIATKPKEKSD